MKIGIDARMLGPSFGIGRYIEQLIAYLEQIDTVNQYFIFLRSENWDTYNPKAGNFQKVKVDIPWYSFQEQLILPSVIRKQNLDLMHFPHFNVPILYRGPFVVTIHDLIMFHYPRAEATTLGPVIFWMKDKIHRFVVRRAVKKSHCIITTSQFTLHDIVKTLGVSKEKIVVTYQAPFELRDREQETREREQESKKEEKMLKTYNINKPYILYVGAAYPHKNLEKLVEAWKMFEEKYGKNYQLVLVGKEDYFYKRLKSTINHHQSVVFTGFVDDETLIGLYENAHLYVFPSLYEGFGLPPLEAMSCGTPVVSSNASCLPEILGEAAMYFDPENVEQIADVMYGVLSNKDIQMELHENARQHLKQFSWNKLARETLEIYEKTSDKH
ncbi:MAG: glycosyltransferase family 1 protein [Candidatus Magasanikbacteria bacterium]